MKNKFKLLLLLFCISSGMAFAQTRITGTVVDEKGDPIVGASVVVQGSGIGSSSDVNGRFSIAINNQAKNLVVSSIGYVKQIIPIENKTQFSIVLKDDAKTLQDVEITAEFGMKRIARAVGSSAQNVKASDIIESGRDNFISALQGRVSGMNVISSSGAPGASNTVVLRSVTSISGNNQPLYVIDGIPMNNSSFDASTLGKASLGSNNLDFSSRGNDFNPEDIESMTVLKGAAAAVLYGSEASNGAIIITTKKGRAGKGQITYSNTFRWDNSYGYPEIQQKYANGAYGTTNYYYTSRYGGLYPEGTTLYDNISSVFQTGFTNKHNLSIDAGTDKSTMRAGFSYLGQQGVVKTTSYDRLNLSLSGKSQITKWLAFEANMQYTNTKNNKVMKGTDGPLYMAMRWPIVDDMSNYYASDGVRMRMPDYYTDTDLLNPMFGLYKNKYYDTSNRFLITTSSTVNIKNLFLRAVLGWDVAMQDFIISQHPYYSNNNLGDGYYNLTKSNFSNPTLNLLTGYNNSFFNDKFTFSAQLGYHQLENGVTQVITAGSKFIIPDMQSINNVTPATVTGSQRTTKRRIQAISGQFEFGYNNLAFLTLRGRNDWSSTLPKENNSYFYPAVEGSFVVTELGNLKNNKTMDYLKLRATWARVGRDAGPLEIDPQLIPTNLTGGGFKYDFTGPNKNLKPEMTSSREIGFEAKFFDSRIATDFTYFATHCSEQIVKNFRLSYATGFVLNTMNVGTFNTWGWEWHIDADIIRQSNGLKWNVGFNASHTGSKVVDLPANVAEYYNPYTWASGNLRNGIIVGNPVSTITGLAYKRNDAGQILIDPTTGLPLTETNKWSVLGDREPLLRYGFSTVLSYKGVRLSALLAGRYKATVVNGTKRTMMSTGTSIESVNLRERGPIIFNGVLKDGNENTANPTPNNIAVDYRTYGASVYAGADEDWVEKNVNYLRLQELRVSYRLPGSLTKNLKILSFADIFVQGNDLFILTNYSGIDAAGNVVSASAGGTGGEGYDVWSLPSPRGISIGFNLTFN